MGDACNYKVAFFDSEILCHNMMARDPDGRTIWIMSTHRGNPASKKTEELLSDIFEYAQSAFWETQFEHPCIGSKTLGELMRCEGPLKAVFPLWIETSGGVFVEIRSGDILSPPKDSMVNWMRILYSIYKSQGIEHLRRYGRSIISHDLGL